MSNTVSASIVGAPVRHSPQPDPVADGRSGKPFAPDDSFALSLFDKAFEQGSEQESLARLP